MNISNAVTVGQVYLGLTAFALFVCSLAIFAIAVWLHLKYRQKW